jgi:hypothetical protein
MTEAEWTEFFRLMGKANEAAKEDVDVVPTRADSEGAVEVLHEFVTEAGLALQDSGLLDGETTAVDVGGETGSGS